LSHTEIFRSVEDFYKKFYSAHRRSPSIVGEMVASPEMMKRRLREASSSFHFSARGTTPLEADRSHRRRFRRRARGQ